MIITKLTISYDHEGDVLEVLFEKPIVGEQAYVRILNPAIQELLAV